MSLRCIHLAHKLISLSSDIYCHIFPRDILLTLPQRTEMNTTSQHRAAIAVPSRQMKLASILYTQNEPFFDLHQIIHCCWIKQNKACIVAINYSAMLSTLSELECWRNLKLQSFTGAPQMTLPYVILSYQWTFTQWSLASKFPLSLLSYKN